jgi:hypothetical protein
VNLVVVPPDNLPSAWRAAERYALAALHHDDYADAERIKADVFSGMALLWLAINEEPRIVGAGITHLVIGVAGKVCEIIAWGADDQRKCAPLLSVVEAYAKHEGCVATRLIGRKGWARLLQDYKIKALIMEKVI